MARQGMAIAGQANAPFTSGSKYHRVLAAMAGIADCAPIFAYIFASTPPAFVGAGLVVKLLIVALLPFRRPALSSASFVLVFAAVSAISLIASPYQNSDAPLQLAAMSISLLLSVYIVADRERLVSYGKAFVDTVCATSLLYLALALIGTIPVNGRALYFSETHPNLGSEINAIALMAACIFFRGKAIIFRALILVAPVLLMQGRSALLAMLIALAITFLNDGMAYARRYPAAIFGAFILAVALVSVTAIGFTEEILNAVFLLDDPYRGQGTGLVGRTDRWQMAYDLFMQSPIVGNGSAIYEVREIESPHNFFLYGFANLGLMFLIVLGLMIYHGVRMWHRDRRAASILAATLAMLMLNDRFFNLNPYPFVFFVLLLGFSALPLAQGPAATLRQYGQTISKAAFRAQVAARAGGPAAEGATGHP
ncbi:O-antigen ligase family protein [Altererythrobacter fulvus]|uniref:O-antigen ligase family protein n=1 Tax=Caenibius fulvus TaxID=2126012 RepID=UPI0030189342